ncbi:MAG: FliH/SctL family protein [Planctomycetota bacterium]
MATILKSDNSSNSANVEAVTFNLADVQQQAECIVQEAKLQADAILRKAQEEAENVMAAARNHGLAVAEAEIQKQVDDQAKRLSDEKCQSSIAACNASLTQLHDVANEWLTQWRNETVDLSLQIAEKLVDCEIQHNRSVILRKWLTRAFESIGKTNLIHITVNPADRAQLDAMLSETIGQIPFATQVEITSDKNVEFGGCKVRSEFGEIDMQLASQLTRLAEELAHADCN